jgi:hypothetical protein
LGSVSRRRHDFRRRLRNRNSHAMIATGRFVVEFLDGTTIRGLIIIFPTLLGWHSLRLAALRRDRCLACIRRAAGLGDQPPIHARWRTFEASTSYHRLSAEMALYAVALILGLPAEAPSAGECDYCHGGGSRRSRRAIVWPPFPPAVPSKLAQPAFRLGHYQAIRRYRPDWGRRLRSVPQAVPVSRLDGWDSSERHLDVSSLIAAAWHIQHGFGAGRLR